jgi:hypothetical protein
MSAQPTTPMDSAPTVEGGLRNPSSKRLSTARAPNVVPMSEIDAPQNIDPAEGPPSKVPRPSPHILRATGTPTGTTTPVKPVGGGGTFVTQLQALPAMNNNGQPLASPHLQRVQSVPANESKAAAPTRAIWRCTITVENQTMTHSVLIRKLEGSFWVWLPSVLTEVFPNDLDLIRQLPGMNADPQQMPREFVRLYYDTNLKIYGFFLPLWDNSGLSNIAVKVRPAD